MENLTSKLILVSVIAFVTFSFNAKAQILLTNDQTAFDAATLTNQYVDNFEDLGVTPGNLGFLTYVTYTDTAGSFYDTVSDATGSPTGVYIVESDASGNPVGAGDGSAFMVNNSNGAVTFTANSGFTGIGANLFAVASAANTIKFTVTAALVANPATTISDTFTLTLPAATASPSDYFAGFVAPLGYDITGISYPTVPDGNGPGIDNFTAGKVDYSVTIPFVPEPATWAMLLGGLGSLGFWLRRRNA